MNRIWRLSEPHQRKEAVDKVMKLCPDIVLMDIQMESRMAGIEAIENKGN